MGVRGLGLSLVAWWCAAAALGRAGADVVGQVDPTPEGPGLRTLVVVEGAVGAVGAASYSVFLDDLRRQGHMLTLVGTTSTVAVKGPLESYGEAVYDTVVLFAPEVALPLEENQGRSGLSVAGLLRFVDEGGNLVVAAGAADGTVVQSTRDLVKELTNGALVSEAGALVVDHGGPALAAGGRDHADVVARASGTAAARAVLGDAVPEAAPVVVRGAALLGVVSPMDEVMGTDQEVQASEVQLMSLLDVSASAHSFRPYTAAGSEAEVATGPRDVAVALAVQTRGNARVAVLAGADMCSDRLYAATLADGGAAPAPAGNRAFCGRLAAWVSKQANYVRPLAVRHHREGEAVAPAMYRIKEPVVYEMDLAEWDASAGRWAPYAADDVQVEFRMLHPYWRLTLDDQGNGTFRTAFDTPDKYGVYKFSVRYNRPGYSRVHVEHEAPTRPFRHNEYERFIVTAFPYYASIASMGVGFFVFGLAYLYTPDGGEAPAAAAAAAAVAPASPTPKTGKGKSKTS